MTELKKSLTNVQFFSIGFGSVVGVGWIIYLGVWHQHAGPIGTVVAFAIGGLLLSLVALCYAEIGTMFPVAGAEAVYAYGAFGSMTSFVIGWGMVLLLITIIPYISI